MRYLSVLAAVLVSAISGLEGDFRGKPVRHVKVRNCLECGKKHQHDNSFCSAGCCKTYRAANRGG